MAVRRVGACGDVSARHVSVSLMALQRIADSEEGVSEENENFKKALLAKGLAITMEFEHEPMLRVEVLTKALERVALEGMPLELLQEILEMVLGNMEDVLSQGLTSEPPGLVKPM